MKNRDLFLKDPLHSELLNNGVAEVRDMETPEELRTLRYELETFVCEGQYEGGLSRILNSYISNINNPEQASVWIAGFFGSGKSHLAKMLRYLWIDFEFSDKATARGIVNLPTAVSDSLKEISTIGKRLGGLHSVAGTISSGAGDRVRLALLGMIFKSVGLPEAYPLARFVLWLKSNGMYEQVLRHVQDAGKDFNHELHQLYVSPLISGALLKADPSFAVSITETRSLLKNQFPNVDDVSLSQMTDAINEALSLNGKFPCTVIVLDEVQQYISDNPNRTFGVQEVVETCAKKFGGKLLFVGTGQSALSGTPQLQKLQGRFRVAVQLSDTDVETVIRKVILAKKPSAEPAVREILEDHSGEISRHLVGTQIQPVKGDDLFAVADYPLLPVRNRFWERVLRALDQAGTSGQLRNQLKVVHEAVKHTAEQEVGTVVPADFIYDQISVDLLQTGVLLPEIDQLIQNQKKEGPDGLLRSRLCALTFLIGKLPREKGADIGLRATADSLADLLVDNLKAGSAEVRKKVQDTLKVLVDKSILIQLENEYRLQTRESSDWDREFHERYGKIINDDQRIASDRADALRNECGERIALLKVNQGTSKSIRKLELFFSQTTPDQKGQTIPVWIRDEWTDSEATIMSDVRTAGTSSQLIFVYLPRRNPNELKKALATFHAANETLLVRGTPTSQAGIEARQAMEARRSDAQNILNAALDDVFSGARVFLAGQTEFTGTALNDMVLEAGRAALDRLYPRFSVADDPRWSKVVERGKKGDGNALEALDYEGEPTDHPVCSAILKEIGAGKKGIELRKHFAGSPFGWFQDAVDGALLVLFIAGKLKAQQDGKPLELKQLDQTKIGVAEFRTEDVVVTTVHRIALRKLFQTAGVDCKPNEESPAARSFLEKMLGLASKASGDSPLPVKPDTYHLLLLQGQTANEQLGSLYEQREQLKEQAIEWAKTSDEISKRFPRWETLNKLLKHTADLEVAAEVGPEVEAIRNQRSLLADPDPIPSLNDRLVVALRKELTALHQCYEQDFTARKASLESQSSWGALTSSQREQILRDAQLAAVPQLSVGSESEILRTLDAHSIKDWRLMIDALPNRFEKAQIAAAQLLKPKAVHITLPAATIETEAELDQWLGEVREEISAQLANGPVIV